MRLIAEQSSLLIVDVQEALVPVMCDARSVYGNCALLMRAADRLRVPVTVTEQYPKGLGPTVGELRDLAPPDSILEKIHFSSAHEPTILEHVRAKSRRQLVIAGIEAHICVLQSALGFADAGWQVFVVADACSSRLAANHTAAMARMSAAGLSIVTTEMVVFEWLHRAATPEFKDLSKLVK